MRTTPPQAEARFLIYALGGGWGHLTRAVALANALPFGQTRILTNSPYASLVDLSVEQVTPEAAASIVRAFPGANVLVS